MRIKLKNIFAVSAVLYLAAVLFDETVPSYTKHISSKFENSVDTAHSPKTRKFRPFDFATCFPSYKTSYFIDAKCHTRVEVGPVIVHKSFRTTKNKAQCAYILSSYVKRALKSSYYKLCVSGAFI